MAWKLNYFPHRKFMKILYTYFFINLNTLVLCCRSQEIRSVLGLPEHFMWKPNYIKWPLKSAKRKNTIFVKTQYIPICSYCPKLYIPYNHTHMHIHIHILCTQYTPIHMFIYTQASICLHVCVNLHISISEYRRHIIIFCINI